MQSFPENDRTSVLTGETRILLEHKETAIAWISQISFCAVKWLYQQVINFSLEQLLWSQGLNQFKTALN